MGTDAQVQVAASCRAQVLHRMTPAGTSHIAGDMKDAHPPSHSPTPELCNEMRLPRLDFGTRVEIPRNTLGQVKLPPHDLPSSQTRQTVSYKEVP